MNPSSKRRRQDSDNLLLLQVDRQDQEPDTISVGQHSSRSRRKKRNIDQHHLQVYQTHEADAISSSRQSQTQQSSRRK